MRIRRFLLAALLPGAAPLASCDGGPFSSGDAPLAAFRYSGVASGAFDVHAPRPASGLDTPPFVAGYTLDSNAFWIVSFGLTSGRRDMLLVQGPRAPGEYAIGNCGVEPVCATVSGALGVDDGNGSPVEGGRQFYLTTGTLTLLAPPRDGWVRGRFSGTAQVAVYSGGAWRPEGTMTVTDGAFQAELAAQPVDPY